MNLERAVTGAAFRKAAAALLAGAALAVAAPAANAGLPNVFVGLCSDQVWWQVSDFDAGWRVAVQRWAGIDVTRVAFRWADLERSPGVWDYAVADHTVRRLASNGMRTLPVLQTPPAFGSAAPSDPKPGIYPPKDFDQFAAFGVRMLRRYGPGGAFWADNPELPYLPLRAWQVWNEPNIWPWWASGPNAAEYVRLLRTTAAAMRAADPEVEIVSAGIPDSTLGIPQEGYLRDMYAAGAKGTFDTLGIHAYASEVGGVMDQLKRAREIMREYSDASPMWLTEFGWATGGTISRFTTTEAGQAAKIADAVGRLAGQRDELNLRGFMLFTWQDVYGGRSWSHFSGLIRTDGSGKPSYFSFVDAVVAIRRAAGEEVDPPPPPPPIGEPNPGAGSDAPDSPGSDLVPEWGGSSSVANAFRVLRASVRRIGRHPALTYYPERGSELLVDRVTLPFAVIQGCPRGCRIRAHYELTARSRTGTEARIRVRMQRFRLRKPRSRVLRIVLTDERLERVRRADTVLVRVTLRRQGRAQSSATRVATVQLVLAPVQG